MIYPGDLFAGILYSGILLPLLTLSPLLMFIQKGRWKYVMCVDSCCGRVLHSWIYSLILCP